MHNVIVQLCTGTLLLIQNIASEMLYMLCVSVLPCACSRIRCVQDTNVHMQACKRALKHALTHTHAQQVMVPETRHVQVPKQIMVPVQETIMVPHVRICVRLCVPTFSI